MKGQPVAFYLNFDTIYELERLTQKRRRNKSEIVRDLIEAAAKADDTPRPVPISSTNVTQEATV